MHTKVIYALVLPVGGMNSIRNKVTNTKSEQNPKTFLFIYK